MLSGRSLWLDCRKIHLMHRWHRCYQSCMFTPHSLDHPLLFDLLLWHWVLKTWRQQAGIPHCPLLKLPQAGLAQAPIHHQAGATRGRPLGNLMNSLLRSRTMSRDAPLKVISVGVAVPQCCCLQSSVMRHRARELMTVVGLAALMLADLVTSNPSRLLCSTRATSCVHVPKAI